MAKANISPVFPKLPQRMYKNLMNSVENVNHKMWQKTYGKVIHYYLAFEDIIRHNFGSFSGSSPIDHSSFMKSCLLLDALNVTALGSLERLALHYVLMLPAKTRSKSYAPLAAASAK